MGFIGILFDGEESVLLVSCCHATREYCDHHGEDEGCHRDDVAEALSHCVEQSFTTIEYELSFSEGMRFSTFYNKDNDGNYIHRLFVQRVDSLDVCFGLCSEETSCLGVAYEPSSGRCSGMNDLGRDSGTSTGNVIESYRKVVVEDSSSDSCPFACDETEE